MDELEGRLDGGAHRRLVMSAAEGHMNMLRVWGGGIYEPDAFYDAADEVRCVRCVCCVCVVCVCVGVCVCVCVCVCWCVCVRKSQKVTSSDDAWQ